MKAGRPGVGVGGAGRVVLVSAFCSPGILGSSLHTCFRRLKLRTGSVCCGTKVLSTSNFSVFLGLLLLLQPQLNKPNI